MHIDSLNDLNLHDTVIHSAALSKHDDLTILELRLDYKLSYDRPGFVPAVLRFVDCAALTATIRCWTTSSEAIMRGESLGYESTVKFLQDIGPIGDTPADVRVHEIETAATASRFLVACRRLELQLDGTT